MRNPSNMEDNEQTKQKKSNMEKTKTMQEESFKTKAVTSAFGSTRKDTVVLKQEHNPPKRRTKSVLEN